MYYEFKLLYCPVPTRLTNKKLQRMMGQDKASVLQQKRQRGFFPMWSVDHYILLYRVNSHGMKNNLCFPVIAGQRLVSAFFLKKWFDLLLIHLYFGWVNSLCHSRGKKILHLLFLHPKACCRRLKVNLNSVRISLPGSILCSPIMMAKFIISLLKETQWKTVLGSHQMWVQTG